MDQCWSGFCTPGRLTLEVIPQVLPLVVEQLFIPLSSWGIVMGAGIGDRVGNKVVREIWVVDMTVKGKLQDPSPRKLKLVAQCVHVRSNQAQIFDNKGQAAQLFAHCFKKACARARRPLSGLSGRCSCGNVPGGRKPAEVIQTNRIHVSKQSPQPVDGPPITSGAKRVPVVNRIPPQLSLCAEIVGRDAGNEAWPAMLVEQEQLWICPNIAGIRRNKER